MVSIKARALEWETDKAFVLVPPADPFYKVAAKVSSARPASAVALAGAGAGGSGAGGASSDGGSGGSGPVKSALHKEQDAEKAAGDLLGFSSSLSSSSSSSSSLSSSSRGGGVRFAEGPSPNSAARFGPDRRGGPGGPEDDEEDEDRTRNRFADSEEEEEEEDGRGHEVYAASRWGSGGGGMVGGVWMPSLSSAAGTRAESMHSCFNF